MEPLPLLKYVRVLTSLEEKHRDNLLRPQGPAVKGDASFFFVFVCLFVVNVIILVCFGAVNISHSIV